MPDALAQRFAIFRASQPDFALDVCDAGTRDAPIWHAANMSDEQLVSALETAPAHRFADWPNQSVPKVTAGVYTIWDGGRFIYVGMSGRALTADRIEAPDEPTKVKGLWTRLNSHALGRRSGDQFCVYVCDRFVVPHLSDEQQAEIGDGKLSLDALTRKHIHDHYEYRYVTVANGVDALALERDVQRGALSTGRPFLNPL